MKVARTVFIATLSVALLSPLPVHAAVKAGTKCTKLGTTTTYSGKKFTCIKKNGKLIWNGGVVVKKDDVVQGKCPVKLAADLKTGITQTRANALLTMTEAEAESCAMKLGWGYRVGQRDDEMFALTMEYSPSRVTVTIMNGLVTQSLVG